MESDDEFSNRLMQLMAMRFCRVTKFKIAVDVDDEVMDVEVIFKRIGAVDRWNKNFDEILNIYRNMEESGYLKFISGEHNEDYGNLKIQIYGAQNIYLFMYSLLNPMHCDEEESKGDGEIYM